MGPQVKRLLMMSAAATTVSLGAVPAMAQRHAPVERADVIYRGNPHSGQNARAAERSAKPQVRVENEVAAQNPQPRPEMRGSSSQGGPTRAIENQIVRPDRAEHAERAEESNQRHYRVDARRDRQANAPQERPTRTVENEVVRPDRHDRASEGNRNRYKVNTRPVQQAETPRNSGGGQAAPPDGRRDWRPADRGDHADRNDNWHNRPGEHHEDREDWRKDKRYGHVVRDGYRRPPVVIVRPSPHYRYRPHWWGRQVFYYDNRYQGYGYDYTSYYRPGYGFYGSQYGSGWATLYPWLRSDPAARHWVLWNFDDNRNGRLGNNEAREANYEFDRYADRNGDGRLSEREIRYGIEELRDEYRYSYQYG